MLTTPGFQRHKLSSDTTQIPTESRAQTANICIEAMLTRFVYDSKSSKICLHLGMQKETLNLKQNQSQNITAHGVILQGNKHVFEAVKCLDT